ncbi:hypothetical protein G6O67_007493 [Ophiocordyceps sinensis]|uniref:Uncharacterized protein n=2 Tax=Ophiocordyceps sinensis TaxID=72228 RepID=A0A8H4LUA3_9HYPO|nr:hypothetical protein G6O67_007493 [Ophiocordyceps sinensis]
MSLASQSLQDITGLLGRRSHALIPKDQLRLVEQPDSWAANFRDSQAHIPGHVLETTKQAYRASKGASSRNDDHVEGKSLSVQDDSVSNVRHEDGPGRAPASSAPPEDMCPSSPGESIPWSSSPHRSQPPKQAHINSSIIRETPKAPSFRALPPLESQVLQGVYPEGTSSSNDDDDLEMALPQAQASADAPVNIAAARMVPSATPYRVDNTQAVGTPPPCAQPSQPVEFPATAAINAKSFSPKPPVDGRRHRHKMIELTDSPVKPVASAKVGRRMPATKMFVDDVSSSHDTSSNSMVPATCQDASALSRVATSIEPTTALQPVTPRPGTGQTDQDGRKLGVLNPSRPTHPGRTRPLVRQAAQAWPTEPANQQLDPYRVFVAEYPDYVTCHGGSLWNFVRACVCVNYLRKERLLREYLFDDFVRAFSVGYLQYVARAGSGQDPLPAVEWFNLLGGAPLYDRMVVSRKNLEAILASFPEEVKKARNIIKNDDEDDDDAIERARPAERESPRVTGPMPSEPLSLPAPTPRSAVGAGRLETPGAERPPSRLETPPVLEAPGSLTQALRPPSPHLGSDGPLPSSAAPTPSASARSKRPPLLSRYFPRLSGDAGSGRARKRSPEDLARLQAYLLRRKMSGNRSVASGR